MEDCSCRRPPVLVGCRLVALAAALAVGVTMDLLACILWTNWWPLFVVGCYLAAPLPNILFSQCSYDEASSMAWLNERARGFKDTGYFLTGILVTSGFGLPLVFYHSHMIELGPMFLCMAGGAVIYLSIELYIHFFHRTEDDDGF